MSSSNSRTLTVTKLKMPPKRDWSSTTPKMKRKDWKNKRLPSRDFANSSRKSWVIRSKRY
jgi:hypothetical protein